MSKIYFSKRDMMKKIASSDKHIPNKNESKLLRKLMSYNNMSESEIRSIKKYRIMLSNDRSKGVKSTLNKRDKFLKNLLKIVTKELKLPKAHPKTKDLFLKTIKDQRYSYVFAIIPEDNYINEWMKKNMV